MGGLGQAGQREAAVSQRHHPLRHRSDAASPAALLLDSMPASWAAHVCDPAPQPTHLVSAAAGDSRVFCPDAEGQLIQTYTVTPTALQPALPLPEASQSQLTYVRSWSWTGTPPGIGILATWDLKHLPTTQTRLWYSLSLSHQASSFLHLQADDTTVHASTPADAQAVLDGSIALHVDATGARLQRSKSIGMGIGSLQHLIGPDEATGITFSAAATTFVAANRPVVAGAAHLYPAVDQGGIALVDKPS
ncbi:g2768 [Coccomyxa viridis]|uniref:G2768 protein n=1 Tax=Coccomyxa viridis TaxID=1274662 RepID=A0ABP1FT57_9CHLO